MMALNSDFLQTGVSKAQGFRWIYADLTESARVLAHAHLSGRTAALALSEALAVVAILSADLETPEETVSFEARCAGPLESVLVEATFSGALRGFTGKKILNAFDCEAEPDLNAVFGTEGVIRIMRSIPGKILAQSGFSPLSLRPELVLNQFYVSALQREIVTMITATPSGDGVDRIRAFAVERLPDGDLENFNMLRTQISAGMFRDACDAAKSPEALCLELGMDGIVADEPRNLFFGCRCTRDKARETLQTLSRDELLAMIKANRNTDIFCHMCGKCHSFTPHDLSKIVNQKFE